MNMTKVKIGTASWTDLFLSLMAACIIQPVDLLFRLRSGGSKTKRILVLLAVVAIASVAAAACGDDGGDANGDGDDDLVSGPTSGVGPGISSGVGPGIFVGQALVSDLTGPLLINGQLHVENGRARLCEALAESFPPQCRGRFLVVQGLDLTTIDGLTSEGSVTWSDQTVQVLGTVEGEVLTVAGTVR